MLFKVLKRLIETKGLTEDLKEKIDILYGVGRLTTPEYQQLIDTKAAD